MTSRPHRRIAGLRVRQVLLTLPLLACGSCATAIHSSVDTKLLPPIRKVALVPPIIGGVSLPVFPLLDAGIVRAAVNGISEQIVAAEQAVVSGYGDLLAAHLRNDLRLEVVAMEARHVEASAQKPAEPVAKGNDSPPHFPKVFARDLDPLAFRNRQIASLASVDLAADARRICKALDVDAIAVSYTRLEVDRVDMILGCTARLNSWFDVVDRDGRYVMRLDFSTDNTGVRFSPSDVKGFERVLRAFDTWVVKMFLEARRKLPPAPKEGKTP